MRVKSMMCNRRLWMGAFIILLIAECLAWQLYAGTEDESGRAPAVRASQTDSSGRAAEVPPAVPEGMTDIHDIKPIQWSAPAFNFRLAVIIGSVLVLLLILFIILKCMWKRKQSILAPPPDMPPHITALAALRALRTASSQMDPRTFYFQLSHIMRSYLKGRYQLNALEMTQEELWAHMSKMPFETALRRDLKDFLENSDRIKFAGEDAEARRMRQELEFAETFVQKTRPETESDEDDA